MKQEINEKIELRDVYNSRSISFLLNELVSRSRSFELFIVEDMSGDQGFLRKLKNDESASSFKNFKHYINSINEKTDHNTLEDFILNSVPDYEILEDSDQNIYIWTKQNELLKKYSINLIKYFNSLKENVQNQPEYKIKNLLTTLINIIKIYQAIYEVTEKEIELKFNKRDFSIVEDENFNFSPTELTLNNLNIRPTQKESLSNFYKIIGKHILKLFGVKQRDIDLLEELGSSERIKEFVDKAPIVNSSSLKSYTPVRRSFIRFLERLYDKDRGFKTLSQFLSELEKIDKSIDPQLLRNSQNIFNSLSGLNEISSFNKIIINALTQYPLVEQIMDSNRDHLDILILGAGTYGRTFLDLALQTGQILDTKLNITIIDRDIDYVINRYTSEKPLLKDFIKVIKKTYDREGQKTEEIFYDHLNNDTDYFAPYATITFTELPDQYKNLTHYDGDFLEAVKQIYDEQESDFNYIFISLGSDDLNATTNEAFLSYLKEIESKEKIQILYIQSNTQSESKNYNQISSDPLYIPDLSYEISPVLRQIALNISQIWKNQDNPDINFLMEQFNDPFYQETLLLSALSILNNLRKLGLDKAKINLLNNKSSYANMLDSAILFNKEIKSDEEILEKLALYDHRRFIIDRVTKGWTRPEGEEESLIISDTILSYGKDIDNKISPKLVRRKASLTPVERWNDLKAKESDDDLDKVSLNTTKKYRDYRRRFLNNTSDYDEIVNSMSRTLTSGQYHELNKVDKNTIDFTYKNYLLCLNSIIYESQSYSKRYDEYLEQFLEQVRKILPISYSKIKEKTDAITKIFRPLIKSNFNQDYKGATFNLIKNLDFILSNRSDLNLVSIFNTGSGNNLVDELFKNFVTTCIIQPKTHYFLFLCPDQQTYDLFLSVFDQISEFIKIRKLRTQFRFLIALNKDIVQKENLKEYITQKSSNLLKPRIHFYDDPKDALNWFLKILRRLEQEDNLDYIEISNQLLDPFISNRLINYIIEKEYPYFIFDPIREEFKHIKKNSPIRFINLEQYYITVNDIFALSNKVLNTINLPEEDEKHSILWDLYTGNYLIDYTENKRKEERRFNKSKASNNKYKNKDKNQNNKSKGPNFFYPLSTGVTTWYNFSSKLRNRFIHEFSFYCSNNKNVNNQPPNDKLVYKIDFPKDCFEAAYFILSTLKERNVVGKNSAIYFDNEDNCYIELETFEDTVNKIYYAPHSKQLIEIFTNQKFLKDIRLIDLNNYIDSNGVEIVKFIFKDLEIKDFLVNKEDDKMFELYNFSSASNVDFKDLNRNEVAMILFLKELEKIDVISNLKFRYQKGTIKEEVDLTKDFDFKEPIKILADFTINYNRYRKLLETEGRMLEEYSYLDLLTNNYFDDIVCGFEVLDSNNEGPEAEFDLILTKGFKTYFIECKAVYKLKRQFFNNLEAKSNKFSANAAKILLTLNYFDSDSIRKSNETLVEESAKSLNILSLRGLDYITNISKTLEEIDKERENSTIWSAYSSKFYRKTDGDRIRFNSQKKTNYKGNKENTDHDK